MSKDKKPPKTWVDKVKGSTKAVNEDNNKARGRSLGEIKSASTSQPKSKKSDEQKDAALKMGKEAAGKNWTKKIEPKKPIEKGVARIKAAAGKSSPPQPQKAEVQKNAKPPAKKVESKSPEKTTSKPIPEPKKTGIAKLKAATPKKAPNSSKKPPVKKPPTKSR